MTTYHPVDRNNYANKGWRRHENYHFSANDAIAALVVQELPKAQISLPIAFIQVDEHFMPVAVQGLRPGKNLFVATDGRWLAGYIPAIYRGYPFRLANAENERQVLCFDSDSALLTDAPEGESFFNADGTPSPATTEILNFLTQVEGNRRVTKRICATLQENDLIQPWPIKVQTDGGQQAIDGLFRIDEQALNQLPADAFIQLREVGALPVAYCQLLSIQHLPLLGRLAQAHAQSEAGQAQKNTPSGELDLEFLNDGGSINFGNF